MNTASGLNFQKVDMARLSFVKRMGDDIKRDCEGQADRRAKETFSSQM